MTNPTSLCRVCQHDRLLHDSWGCKTKCGCGVSIIYLTSLFRIADDDDHQSERELVEIGLSLVRQDDRLREADVLEMIRRSREEQNN